MINMKEKKGILPWYLRDTPFFIISFLFAPIALIILMIKSKDIDREVLTDRAFIVALFSVFFIMHFLPRNAFTITISILIFLFTSFMLVLKFGKDE